MTHDTWSPENVNWLLQQESVVGLIVVLCITFVLAAFAGRRK